MKLKLVAASLSILGVISAPAFANHHTDMQAKPAHDYKDMGVLCTIPAQQKTFVEANQNIGRALPNPCKPGWYDRIRVTGGINVDAGKWGNRNANIMGENYQRLSLNDVYVNFEGTLNNWTKVFASVSYNTATTVANPSSFNIYGASEYSAAYANNISSNGMNNVQLEQGFATFGDFSVSPFFVQVGKFFQDFSRYEIHPITRSVTQVMSESLTTSAKLGFIAGGLNGGIYALNNPIARVGSLYTNANYGISLGYDQNNDDFGFDLGAGYLYNMMGVNDIAFSVTNYTSGGYNSRAGGIALYGDVNYGPFMLAARYTQAVQRFNPNDLSKNGAADLAGPVVTPLGTANTAATLLPGTVGAKPAAGMVQAGYGFDYFWNRSQNVYLGYQTTNQAAALNLPKTRWLAGYGIEVVKDTSLGIEWDHDNQYKVANGGAGNTTNLVSLRVSAKFS